MQCLKRNNFCKAYERFVTNIQCEDCGLKDFYRIYETEKCHYQIKFVIKNVKIKKEDFLSLKKYAKNNGDYTVNHHIGMAIREYLENHK